MQVRSSADHSSALLSVTESDDSVTLQPLFRRHAEGHVLEANELTALEMAIIRGDAETVKTLIATQLEAKSNNKTVDSPPSIVISRSEPEINDIMEDACVEVQNSNKSICNPISMSIFCSDLEITEILVKAGLIIDNINKNDFDAFIYCIKHNLIAEAELMLKAGFDPNYCSTAFYANYLTPLSLALHWNRHEILELLIKAGADLEQPVESNYQFTALLAAVSMSDLQSVKILLAHGANTEAKDNKGQTALIMASVNDALEIVNELLAHGAEVNATDMHQRSAVLIAALQDNKDIMNALIRRGANLYLPDKDGRTVREVIITRENAKSILMSDSPELKSQRDELIVNSILSRNNIKPELARSIKKSMNLNKASIDLHKAIERNDIGFIYELLDVGADPEQKDKQGLSALLIAAQKPSLEAVQLLLEAAANIKAQDPEGNTALHYAAKQAHWPLIELLLKHGALSLIDIRNKRGKRPRDLLSYEQIFKFTQLTRHYPHPILLAYLLSDGEDYVDSLAYAEQAMKDSALHWAAVHNKQDLYESLLKYGANINSQDEDGNTALHLAIKNKNFELANTLKAFGADLSIANKQGKMPAFFAPNSLKARFSPLSLEDAAKASAAASKHELIEDLSAATEQADKNNAIELDNRRNWVRLMQAYRQRLEACQTELEDLSRELTKIGPELDSEACTKYQKRAHDLYKAIMNFAMNLHLSNKSVQKIKADYHLQKIEKLTARKTSKATETKPVHSEKTDKAQPIKPLPIETVAKAPLIAEPSNKMPSVKATVPLSFYQHHTRLKKADTHESPMISSIRYTLYGIGGQLSELDLASDIDYPTKLYGLIYEVFRLFELLNQIKAPKSPLIDRLRNHLAHQYDVLLKPDNQIVVIRLAKYCRKSMDDIIDYASKLASSFSANLDTTAFEEYFMSLGIHKVEHFRDDRPVNELIRSVHEALGILQQFYQRITYDDLASKNAEAVATGSPALFAACKMSVVALNNALCESVNHLELIEKLSAHCDIKTKDRLERSIRSLRNQAAHFGENIIKIKDTVIATEEISPHAIESFHEKFKLLLACFGHSEEARSAARPPAWLTASPSL